MTARTRRASVSWIWIRRRSDVAARRAGRRPRRRAAIAEGDGRQLDRIGRLREHRDDHPALARAYDDARRAEARPRRGVARAAAVVEVQVHPAAGIVEDARREEIRG